MQSVFSDLNLKHCEEEENRELGRTSLGCNSLAQKSQRHQGFRADVCLYFLDRPRVGIMFTQLQNVIAIIISCVVFLAENDNIFFVLDKIIGILGCYFHDMAYCRVFSEIR